MNTSLSPDQRADLIAHEMTLDEKLQMVHGMSGGGRGAAAAAPPTVEELQQRLTATRSNGGAGFIPGIPRLGIPDMQMADAAVGVTRGSARSRYSTLLPSALALASSWDMKAAYDYGARIGAELRDQGYTMSLGGGVDITREPRNGRNFEYLGEDPILAGWLDGEAMRGLQAQGILGDVKHYAFNDQETGRNIGNVVGPDHRDMRETDLLAFEIAVQDAHPAGVMCSYNKVDGDWACENDYLLNQVLKKSIGFQGYVLSDWGGTHSTVKAAMAGLDIEMPGANYFGDGLRQAIAAGTVPEARLDDMVHRILRSEFAVGLFDETRTTKVVDVNAGLADAERIADESIVLLRNANGTLPLPAARLRTVAVIGGHADVGVPSGGGSAQVDPPGGNAAALPAAAGGRGRGGAVYFPSSPLRAMQALAPGAKFIYNDGTDPASAAMAAKSADVAVVFCVQPMAEGRDAATLSLPDQQDALVAAVAAANPHTVVVLETGGPVTMPWVNQTGAVIEAWYPGIRGGEAIANLLFGKVNPSGRLAVTFAARDEDLPHPIYSAPPPPAPPAGAAPTPGGRGRGAATPFDIVYNEGLDVGYKWYDAQKKEPLFPFGFGLSYTTFSYSNLKATPAADGGLQATLDVHNSGKTAGATVAQVYFEFPGAAGEPPHRLIAWQRVDLAPGETKPITLHVPPLNVSVFDTASNAWKVVPGDYTLLAGGSSRDLPANVRVKFAGTP